MKNIFLLLALLSSAMAAHAEEYYRSIDSAGKVHYGDSPLSDAADFDKLKPQTEPAPDNILPFETRRAMEKFPVTLYIGDECGDGCKMAQDYLNKRGVPYTEVYLRKADEIAAFKKASQGDRIPTMNIGKNWLKGFSLDSWSKELNTAGYPQSAPYGYRPIIKSLPNTEMPKSK